MCTGPHVVAGGERCCNKRLSGTSIGGYNSNVHIFIIRHICNSFLSPTLFMKVVAQRRMLSPAAPY
jgi:hypothetical protein